MLLDPTLANNTISYLLMPSFNSNTGIMISFRLSESKHLFLFLISAAKEGLCFPSPPLYKNQYLMAFAVRLVIFVKTDRNVYRRQKHTDRAQTAVWPRCSG